MEKSQLARARTLNDVRDVLFAIAHALESLGDQHACVLHCMQPHRSNFYQQIEHDFSVRVFICSPRNNFKATISSVVLGVSALIVVDDYDSLPSLFSQLGEQAMVGLYVISKSKLASIPDLTQLSTGEIAATIKKDPAHLLYQVDEDSAAGDGQVIELLSAGADCPNLLREAVGVESKGSF